MINRVILYGRLTKDPELRYTSNGIGVSTFTLAIDRKVTNKQGEKETDFIPVVAWRQLGELCANYLKKGQQTIVDGRIQVRNYENKEGRKVYVTEIVAENVQFINGGSNGNGNKTSNQRETPQGNPFGSPNPFALDPKPIDISDDNLPF